MLASLVLATILAAGPAPASQQDLPLRLEFLAGATWDDGKAEVCRYDATRTVYGKERHFETFAVAVKETIGTLSRVKVDPNTEQEPTVEGFKLHLVQGIETENYPYHYAITVLVERSNPFRLIKQSVSSQDGCGVTFQQLNHLGQAWRYWWDSYWEGEGHGFIILRERPMSEEQLLLALRSVDWKEGLEARLPIVWGMHSNRARATEPTPSLVKCGGREKISVPYGTVDCWRIDVTAGDHEARYLIGSSPPYPLVEYSGSEGRTLKLSSLKRWAYWTRKE